MMGAITLRVIRHCRTGAKNRVILVLDEAASAGLIGNYEAQALSEAGKWGLEFHILIQNPFSFGSEEIRTGVLQNCWRHEWFRQGSPEAARLAAEDLGTPLLDPLKIHHTEYRVRTQDLGIERVQTTGASEWHDASGHGGSGTSWNTALWPRRREVRDERRRYMGLTDQILLIQKELMLLRPGYRFVRCDRVTAVPEYVPMASHTRSLPRSHKSLAAISATSALSEERFRSILEGLKLGPLIRLPAFSSDRQDKPAGYQGAAHKLLGR